MATEEIQISQLELAQEVQGDMVFAVDTATDTKSLSVNQLKNHISQPLQANINAVDTSALHKYNISNCITEIPQDIKLELNNGTLTLKAGSKVYVPNGFEANGTTPKFDVITITGDKTFTQNSAIGKNFLYVNKTGTGISRHNNLASGTSVPSGFTGTFYNTSTNDIQYYSNGTAQGTFYSLPIAIITIQTNQTAVVSSIDQVFNGFGYIGSTVFALPGVKGLIPNGRNADGTLKNISVDVTSPRILTLPNSVTLNEDTGRILLGIGNVFARVGYYNEEENYTVTNAGQHLTGLEACKVACTNGIISKLVVKTAFHAVDYNDFEKAMLKEDWVRVSTVPASPDSSKFYYIPEN